ncbi:MAG: flagellar biosynthetic protein FliP [Provencibacterium sp.]|jgi:flagellar biosynthetic protein FliP|nr:flagellar biosynthetic protein FliP [Provencibacterium sp.]
MSKVNAAKRRLKKQVVRFALSALSTLLLVCVCCSVKAYAAVPTITVDLGSGASGDGALGALELLFFLALLALAPSILVMMTSFTRIVIVLSFLRSALGTQQSPPNQVVIGLALFLTLFIMMPTLREINETAYQPYRAGAIEQEEAIDRMVRPMKVFMLKQTKPKDLSLFLSIAQSRGWEGVPSEQTAEETAELLSDVEQNQQRLLSLGLEIIVPSFITSELKRAFEIGFLLFLPFLIIDMVVSSTLMSMGMVMLPPSMIALPFKLMMFVLVDGWGQLFGTLVSGFR